MGGSSSQTIGQRYFAKLTTFIGNPIEKLIGINFDNRGWIFKPDNDESFLRVESPNLYGDKEGGVAGFIDIHTGTADQLPNAAYEKDFPKVSGYPFQSYLLFRGLGKKPATSGGIGQFTQGSPKHYNGSFYHGNSGYMKEMLLWPQRIHVRNDDRLQWYDEKAEIFGGDIDMYMESVQSIRLTTTNKAIYIASQPIEFTETKYVDMNNLSIFKSAPVYAYGSKDFVNAYVRSEIVIETAGTAKCEIQIKYASNRPSISLILPSSSELVTRTQNGSLITETYKADVSFTDPVYVQISDLGPVGESTHLEITSIELKGFYPKNAFGDINPIHKIREILTDDTAMNKPESDVNDQNFRKAADRLRKEGLGLSWSVTEKSCLEAINEICGHIEAGIRMNRQTGLYEMVLFRDDWFAENEIYTLPVNKIKSMQLDGATSVDELINKLNISYYNRDAIKNASFSIAENASIRNLKGHENSEEVKFPYFMNQRNAAVVAQWKLKQMSTPVWQGAFTTGFYQARKWNRYDLLKLEWPRRWNGTILVRILKINLGTGTDVSIDFVEVVPYSSDLSSSIVIDTPVDTTPKPPQPALFKAFELSYLEAVQLNGQKAVDDALAYNPDAGYAAVIAQRPQSNSLNALMYTDTGNEYERAGVIAYCETAELDQSISQINTSFILKDAGDIDMVSSGTQITINQEIMVYQSYDEETGLLTVKRGVLDTIPQNHLAGSVLYFADDFVTVDPTEYVTGEIINVKTLTTTPSGILSIDDVDAQQVEIKARAIRPYAPANVKINGKYWPAYIDTDLTIEWVNRNRVQQTGGEILGWYEAGVSLEPNTATMLVIVERDANMQELATHSLNVTGVNSHTLQRSLMQLDTEYLDISLSTIRDGYSCMNPFHLILVNSKLKAPENVQFKVVKI